MLGQVYGETVLNPEKSARLIMVSQCYNFPRYDALYAVSDLHIGQTKNHCLLQATDAQALAWLIAHLAEVAEAQPEQNLALVLNGDIIDFLTCYEPQVFPPGRQPTYLDVSGACQTFASRSGSQSRLRLDLRVHRQ